MKLFGTKDIKTYVRNYLLDSREQIRGEVVIDIPAGTGFSSRILNEIEANVEANVEAYDLFPELFKVEGVV